MPKADSVKRAKINQRDKAVNKCKEFGMELTEDGKGYHCKLCVITLKTPKIVFAQRHIATKIH